MPHEIDLLTSKVTIYTEKTLHETIVSRNGLSIQCWAEFFYFIYDMIVLLFENI